MKSAVLCSKKTGDIGYDCHNQMVDRLLFQKLKTKNRFIDVYDFDIDRNYIKDCNYIFYTGEIFRQEPPRLLHIYDTWRDFIPDRAIVGIFLAGADSNPLDQYQEILDNTDFIAALEGQTAQYIIDEWPNDIIGIGTSPIFLMDIDKKLRIKSGREKNIIFNISGNREPWRNGCDYIDKLVNIANEYKDHKKFILPTVFGDNYGDNNICVDFYHRVENSNILNGIKIMPFQFIANLDKSMFCVTNRSSTMLMCVFAKTPVLMADENIETIKWAKELGIEDCVCTEQDIEEKFEDMVSNYRDYVDKISHINEVCMSKVSDVTKYLQLN